MKRALSRFASLILAAVILACAFGCGEAADPSDTTEAQGVATTAPETQPEETDDPNWVCDLPDLNYGGTNIKMLVEGQSFAADEFSVNGISGDIVSDAVFRRNSSVEDSLGVALEVKVASSSDVYDVGNTIRALVKSGDNLYQLITIPGYTHTSYALEGDFHNLLDVENLNLGKYYWTQGFNGIMNNGVQQYVCSGAYSISMIRNMYITLYNKDILKDRNVPDLYDLTMNGEWTIGKQAEIIKGLYSDLNGDGARDAGDFYGFVSGVCTSVDPYWVSFNVEILSLDRDTHEYKIELNQERLLDVLTSIGDLILHSDDSWSNGASGDTDGSYTTISINKFANGGCAMTTTMIYQIEHVLTGSAFTGEYGIAPIPKFDKDQVNYYTHTQDQLSLMAIPSTVPAEDKAMIGAVMEKIASESYEEVFPSYYENALSYRYIQNAESKTMLDLIYRGLKVEGCFIYSSKFAILGQLRGIVSPGRYSASILKASTKTWPEKVNSLNEDLAKLRQ